MDLHYSLDDKCKMVNDSLLDSLHSVHKFLDKDPDTYCVNRHD